MPKISNSLLVMLKKTVQMGCLWATRLAQGANRLTDLWPQSLLSGTVSLLGDAFGSGTTSTDSSVDWMLAGFSTVDLNKIRNT